MRLGEMDSSEKIKRSLAIGDMLFPLLAEIGIPVCKRLDFIWLKKMFNNNYIKSKDKNIIQARELINEICEIKGL